MSEIIEEQPNPVDAADDAVEMSGAEVGLTSDEADDDERSMWQMMTIYDVLLLVSLICIGLATLILLFELRTFGDFPLSFPWRTNEL